MANSNASSGGIGFTGLLTIVFIVLKLTHYINWSWWWVLSPVWIAALIVIFILLICLILAVNEVKNKPKPIGKSKWEQRLEEMKKKQNANTI